MAQRTIEVCDACGKEEERIGRHMPPGALAGWTVVNLHRWPVPDASGDMIASFEPAPKSAEASKVPMVKQGRSGSLTLCSSCSDNASIVVSGKTIAFLEEDERDGYGSMVG